MTEPTIQGVLDLARGMCGGGGSIDTFVISDLVKKIVGHAQEMSMPIVDALAKRLAEGGHRDAATALVLDGVSLHAPETGSAWHVALAVGLPSGNGLPALRTLSLLEYVGKPDPVFDSIVEEAIRQRAERLRTASPEELAVMDAEVRAAEKETGMDVDGDPEAVAEDPYGHRFSKMRTDAVVKDESETLRDMLADKGAWKAVASASRSYQSHRGGWMEGHRASCFDDRWDVHFGALNRVAAAAGLGGLLRDVAVDYRARGWRTHLDGDDDDLKTYRASRRAALLAIGLDADGLPAVAARSAIAAVQSFAMGRDLDARIGMLLEVAELVRNNGHDGVENDFAYNDLDDHVALVGPGTDFSAVYFRDQNVAHVVRLHGGGERVSLFSHRLSTDWENTPEDDRFPAVLRGAADGTAPETDALAVFGRTADGYRPVREFRGDIDAVKCWNGFVMDIESAHCCLAEEYGSAAPTP